MKKITLGGNFGSTFRIKVFVLFLFFTISFTGVKAQCLGNSQTFDWSLLTPNPWDETTVLSSTYTTSVCSAPATLTLTLQDPDNVLSNSGTEIDNKRYKMAMRDVTVGDQIRLTIDFSTPVMLNDFKVDDIDNNVTFDDDVTFTASVGGVNVPLVLTAAGDTPSFTIIGQTADGQSDNPSSINDNGSVLVNSNGNAIDKLIISYAAGVARSGLDQVIWLSEDYSVCCPVIDQCDSTISGNIDTDGDSVSDICDNDDDNDGILDTEEGICTPVQSGNWSGTSFNNTTVIAPDLIIRATTNTTTGFSNGNFNPAGTDFWSENLAGNISLQSDYDWNSTLTISFEDALGNPVIVDNPIMHLDRIGSFSGPTQNSADITLLGGLTWSKLGGTKDFHTTSTTARDGGANSSYLSTYTRESSMNDADGTASGSLQIQGAISSFTLQFIQVGGSGIGYDRLELIVFACKSTDTDNDGIPDYHDLDSDGDNCNDVIEAGFTDDDDNGLLGNGIFGAGLTVDGNGLVTSGSDGYTGTNSNVIIPGVAPTITTQPSNAIICEGMDTTFTILTSNADTYQWQLFNGSSWDDLTDSGIHSTTTTNTLTITNASVSDDGNRYRVIVSSSTYACDFKTSEERILTVNAAPTISVTSAPICSADSTTYSLEVTVSSGTVTSTSGTVNNVSGNIWSIERITPGVNINVTATAANGCKRILPVTIPLSCLIANDDMVIIDGDAGGNSINVVNDNDILDGNTAILGGNVTVTTVADPNPGDGVSFDPSTGEVIVLPNTPPGDYTITYTLCSIAIPLACDEAVITITVVPAPNGTVTGHLYSDLNDNSTQDIGEPDLEGVDVNIIDVNGVEQTVSTNLNGDFTANVPIGETVVDIDNTTLPLGSLQTEGTDPTTVNVIGTGITVEENNGFVIVADIDDEIVVYTGISPNGDGINDQFRIVGLDNFPNNTLQIFNRWGVKIFEENGYEQSGARFFEGISEGRATIGTNKELPVGTYFYILEYENASGINMSKSGYLYINR